MGRSRCFRDNDLIRDLVRHIGETVTIFTTSGGESGRGFTGVLVGLDPQFVRLVAVIGPAPACALGSCCDVSSRKHCDFEDEDSDDFQSNSRPRFDCNRIRNTGAIVDIPVNRIVAFVHNTLR